MDLINKLGQFKTYDMVGIANSDGDFSVNSVVFLIYDDMGITRYNLVLEHTKKYNIYSVNNYCNAHIEPQPQLEPLICNV
jgi:hypothetical protein